MATISCPDCGHSVSPLASVCPSCARPSPGVSSSALQQAEKAAKSKKSSEEFLGGVGCFIVGWGINAVLAGMSKGAAGFIMALIIGPLIWMIPG